MGFVRQLSSGTYFIPRPDKKVEAELDKLYIRIPGYLRWVAHITENFNIDDVDFTHIYLIGKGKSLNNINASYFPDPKLPIVCVNHSIYLIEPLGLPNPLFLAQQDPPNIYKGIKATLLIRHAVNNYYPKYPKKYLFHPTELGLKNGTLTAATTVVLLKQRFGLKEVTMISFDILTHNDRSYANLPNKHGTLADHKKRFLPHLKDIKVNWVTPGSPAPVTQTG